MRRWQVSSLPRVRRACRASGRCTSAGWPPCSGCRHADWTALRSVPAPVWCTAVLYLQRAYPPCPCEVLCRGSCRPRCEICHLRRRRRRAGRVNSGTVVRLGPLRGADARELPAFRWRAASPGARDHRTSRTPQPLAPETRQTSTSHATCRPAQTYTG
eukprot:7379174-Prymnesium_polylepis.2